MAQSCSLHPEAPATYRCDGCDQTLCDACVDAGHALFLCRRCGERALPLDAQRQAVVREQRFHEKLARPYGLRDAFLYPFRGMGLFGFLATLLSMAFVSFVLRFGIGCYPLLLALAFWSLLAGLQFKIARTTADGDTELPDWPEYFAWSERLAELVTYLALAVLQFAPLALWVLLGASSGLLGFEPSLPFWIGFAACGWLGTTLWVVAFAATARFGGLTALRFDAHLRALRAAGGEGIAMANRVFAIGGLLFLLRGLLDGVPIAGAAAAGTVGAYWLFTSAHLSGLLYRRHRGEFESIYR